jgi:uncharacterized protein
MSPSFEASVQFAREAVHTTCQRMVAMGLVVGSAGNVSMRVDEHHIIVTAGGVAYEHLAATDHPLVDLRDGSWTGLRAPTSEMALHLGVMRGMPHVGAVVHTHSRHAAAFAVARQDLPFICNENMGPASERILVTEYAVPGTDDLGHHALATFVRQPGSRACLLANHGVVALGADPEQALTIAAQVEWIAEVSFLAKQLGTEHVLAPEVARQVCGNYGLDLAQPNPTDRDPEVLRLSERYGLVPLPVEGGLYRQTWRSPETIDGRVPAGTAIVALWDASQPDGTSTFHRLTRDELWHAYDGDPFRLVLLHPDGSSEERILGRGHEVQTRVPAGVWMGGHVADGGRWSLIGCTMSPGFTPDCFEGALRDTLLAGWPDRAVDIVRLTHEGTPETLRPDLDT